MQRENSISRAHRPGDQPQGFGWGTIAAVVAALVLVSLTIVLVVEVASLPWWVSATFDYPLGNPFCHEQVCGDYTDSARLRNVFPPTYNLVLIALAFAVLQLVFFVSSLVGTGRRLWIMVTGTLGSITLLVAPVYLHFAMPSDFPGGPGPGWFRAFAVVAFFVAATMVSFFAARHFKPIESAPVSPS